MKTRIVVVTSNEDGSILGTYVVPPDLDLPAVQEAFRVAHARWWESRRRDGKYGYVPRPYQGDFLVQAGAVELDDTHPVEVLEF